MGDLPIGWITLAGVVLAALGTGGYFARRDANKMSLLDQYQEDRAADQGRMDTYERRLDASVRRERIRDDYILQLRQHIVDGKPPPPPPFPPALLEGPDGL